VVERAAENAASAPSNLRSFVGNLMGFGNVPRNEKKFLNFAKNSLNVRLDKVASELWSYLLQQQQAAQAAQDQEAPEIEAIEAAAKAAEVTTTVEAPQATDDPLRSKSKKRKANDDEPVRDAEAKTAAGGSGDAPVVDGDNSRIKWARSIKRALKAAPDQRMPEKALRKVVYSDLDDLIGELSEAERKAAFRLELRSLPKAHWDKAEKTVQYSSC